MYLPSSSTQQLPILKDLSSSQRADLLYGHEIKTLSYGQYLFEQGALADRFAIVTSGCLKVVKTRNSKQVLLSLITEGNLVGALIMTEPGVKYPADVISIATTTVIVLPQSTYREYWVKNSLIVERIQQIFHRRCDTFHFDRAIQQLSVEQRVAGFLMYNLAQNSVNKRHFEFKLTRKDIALAIGAEIESVIRVMSRFEKSGIIKTNQSQIEVVQPTTLSKFISDSNEAIPEKDFAEE